MDQSVTNKKTRWKVGSNWTIPLWVNLRLVCSVDKKGVEMMLHRDTKAEYHPLVISMSCSLFCLLINVLTNF
ncbi:hypothetical protein T06_14850 [Trichinella sp. T6]|nr:hypothetical protein T06_14850 [Trichinella sp. T6]